MVNSENASSTGVDTKTLAEMVRQGRVDDALSAGEKALAEEPERKELLQFMAGICSVRGDANGFIGYTERFLELDPDNLLGMTGLGAMLEHLGRHEEARDIYRRAVRADDNNAFSFLYLMSALEALGDDAGALTAAFLAYDRHFKIFTLVNDTRLQEQLRKRIARAEVLVRAALEKVVRGGLERARAKHPEADISRIERAEWWDVFMDPIDYQHPEQKPRWLYIPGLKPQSIFPREEFGWVAGLEAAWPAILEEVLADLTPERDAQPYVDTGQETHEGWKKLDGSMNWCVAHFFKEGRRNPETYKRFPATGAALDKILEVQKSETLMEAFFSIMEPGVELPPHYGQTNAALTVHLPLIIPDGNAYLRVAGIDHRWIPGETYIFDDTFYHNAWNLTDRTRIVLILTDWHPDLTGPERAALDEIIPARVEAMDGFKLEDILG